MSKSPTHNEFYIQPPPTAAFQLYMTPEGVAVRFTAPAPKSPIHMLNVSEMKKLGGGAVETVFSIINSNLHITFERGRERAVLDWFMGWIQTNSHLLPGNCPAMPQGGQAYFENWAYAYMEPDVERAEAAAVAVVQPAPPPPAITPPQKATGVAVMPRAAEMFPQTPYAAALQPQLPTPPDPVRQETRMELIREMGTRGIKFADGPVPPPKVVPTIQRVALAAEVPIPLELAAGLHDEEPREATLEEVVEAAHDLEGVADLADLALVYREQLRSISDILVSCRLITEEEVKRHGTAGAVRRRFMPETLPQLGGEKTSSNGEVTSDV